jgi:excisionase family DNA binding protein
VKEPPLPEKRLPAQSTTLPALLTVAEAAQQLRVCERMVYTLIRRGEAGAPDGIRAVKLGRQVTRIPASEIGALIERRSGAPRVEAAS